MEQTPHINIRNLHAHHCGGEITYSNDKENHEKDIKGEVYLLAFALPPWHTRLFLGVRTAINMHRLINVLVGR